jgi:hypothetical protein
MPDSELLGLILLPVLRTADSPLYAVGCRHHADYWYSCEAANELEGETSDGSRLNLVRKVRKG